MLASVDVLQCSSARPHRLRVHAHQPDCRLSEARHCVQRRSRSDRCASANGESATPNSRPEIRTSSLSIGTPIADVRRAGREQLCPVLMCGDTKWSRIRAEAAKARSMRCYLVEGLSTVDRHNPSAITYSRRRLSRGNARPRRLHRVNRVGSSIRPARRLNPNDGPAGPAAAVPGRANSGHRSAIDVHGWRSLLTIRRPHREPGPFKHWGRLIA